MVSYVLPWCIPLVSWAHQSPVRGWLSVFTHSFRKELRETCLVQIGGLQSTALDWSSSASMRDALLRVTPVLFKTSARRQVINHWLVTDVFNWPIRCAKGERYISWPIVLKLNMQFLPFTLQFLNSILRGYSMMAGLRARGLECKV